MIIDLRKPDLSQLQINDEVITSKGYKWILLNNNTWRDETSELTWLCIEPLRYSYDEALKLENDLKRLPTKQEFQEAEENGIREVFNMSNNWFWSSSDYPGSLKYAYGFSGNNGDVVDYYRYNSSGVLYVGR